MPAKAKEFIFGLHPVMEAIKSGREIEKIFVKNGLRGGMYAELMAAIKNAGIPYQSVPREKLQRITTGNHQGVVAYISRISYQPLENVLPAVYERGEIPFIVVLDRITDVRNMGAVARSALCAGVHALVVPERGGAMVTADAVKSSAGALNSITVCREPSLVETVRYLKESGLRIVAAGERASSLYFEESYNCPVALILGAEESGISGELADMADADVRIPVTGPVASLNVSAAASVIIFEVIRQRMWQK